MPDLGPVDLSRLVTLQHVHGGQVSLSSNEPGFEDHWDQMLVLEARDLTVVRPLDHATAQCTITPAGIAVVDAMIAAGMAAVPLSPVDAILDQSAPGMLSLRELGWGPGSDEGT